MKISVVCGGKFAAFDQAEQLSKRNALARLITTYYSPSKNARNYSLQPEQVAQNLLPELVMRLPRRIPLLRNFPIWSYYKARLFSRWAAGQIPDSDLIIGWSSFSLHSIRKAKQLGIPFVLERGSSHIVAQQNLLNEEYERCGLSRPKAPTQALEVQEYAETDYICVPSKFAYRSFVQHGISTEKLLHLPYGVNLSIFKPAPKLDAVFRVICVAHITLRKGIHYLLQAVAELKLQNFELLLVGDISPEMLSFMKKFEGSYRHVGAVAFHNLPAIYTQSSVFVLPSLEEGLALVQAQAMACGLPVIGTVNSGAEDIVREGVDGFVVPIRSVDQLKEKILFLYKNEEQRRQMGEAARQQVAAGFSWHDYGERMIALYTRIARHNGARQVG